MLKVLSVFGTRPEAIKMAPVIKELERYPDQVDSVVCVTAQHRQMLDQVLDLFGIEPDVDLNLMEENQNLPSLTGNAMSSLSATITQVKPDLVLVQGDTTTAMVAALASFYQKIPVGHVEAGLRTGNRYYPFPEEINRRLISVLATYHFAPTQTAVDALLAEGFRQENIYLTGNTVIDALLMTVAKPVPPEVTHLLAELGIMAKEPMSKSQGTAIGHKPSASHKLILVTAHRRENFGQPLENICYALREIGRRNPEVEIIYPVHLNPNVQEPVYRILSGQERVHLIAPLEYEKFAHLMARSYLILTDSGGIQEEAPVLGKPVLVMRRETERPEAVETGAVKVVGTDTEALIAETELLLHNPEEYKKMSQAVSPYGDGHAAERIVHILLAEVG